MAFENKIRETMDKMYNAASDWLTLNKKLKWLITGLRKSCIHKRQLKKIVNQMNNNNAYIKNAL